MSLRLTNSVEKSIISVKVELKVIKIIHEPPVNIIESYTPEV